MSSYDSEFKIFSLVITCLNTLFVDYFNMVLYSLSVHCTYNYYYCCCFYHHLSLIIKQELHYLKKKKKKTKTKKKKPHLLIALLPYSLFLSVGLNKLSRLVVES